jgi:two-component system phosphate regulon response regulator PhoB
VIPTARERRNLILIADDDEDILALTSLLLRGANHEVLQARDGEEALQLAFDRHPDLVVLDVRMPKLAGDAVMRCIREDRRTLGVPVILFSAYAADGLIKRGLEQGASDYVIKPFAPDDLLERVEAVLSATRA